MQPRRPVLSGNRVIWAAALVVSAIGGCGPAGPTTYPVRGKVHLGSADVREMAGHHVEAALVGDPGVRASGEIQPDGTFTLQTLHEGAILRGARQGNYQVRIVLSDDDKGRQRRAFQLVGKRPLSFQTSGLSLQVPAPGEVTLELGGK